MKVRLSILAMLALPACMGSGGSSPTVNPTPTSPSVTMNNDFATLLNGVRMGAGEAAVTYDGRIGRAAQEHANDMVTNNYFNVVIPNTGGMDIGDRVTSAGYNWSTIVQLIDRGELTLSEALAEFDNTGMCGGGGQDPCITDDRLKNFAIAKAGVGADQKWVLVLAEPG